MIIIDIEYNIPKNIIYEFAFFNLETNEKNYVVNSQNKRSKYKNNRLSNEALNSFICSVIDSGVVCAYNLPADRAAINKICGYTKDFDYVEARNLLYPIIYQLIARKRKSRLADIWRFYLKLLQIPNTEYNLHTAYDDVEILHTLIEYIVNRYKLDIKKNFINLPDIGDYSLNKNIVKNEFQQLFQFNKEDY